MPPRTQALSRTTGLTRSTPLSRGSVLERRTPIRLVSTKQAAENRVRKAMITRLYPDRPLCAVPWCRQYADDVHEPLTRARGGGIADPENQVPLCRPHHSEIHDTEPGWAYELGLLVRSWDAPGLGGEAA